MQTRLVSPSLVTSLTRLPDSGLSSPRAHFISKDDTNSSGVHTDWSALAIHFLFMGVSRVMGKMATANELSGKPEP